MISMADLDSSNLQLSNDCGEIRHEHEFGTLGVSFVQPDGTIVRLRDNTTVDVYDAVYTYQLLFSCQVAGLKTSSGKLVDAIDAHDTVRLPNGNVLVIATVRYSATELQQLGMSPAKVAAKIDSLQAFIEINRECNIVWEWHVADHIGQFYSREAPNYYLKESSARMFDAVTAFGGGATLQQTQESNTGVANGGRTWTHINGLDYNAKADQIVFSNYASAEFIIIDHSTTTQEAKTNRGGRSGHGGRLLFRYGYNVDPASGNLVASGHAVHWAATDYLRGGMTPPPESYHQLLVYLNGIPENTKLGIKSQPASILKITLPQPMDGGWYPVDSWQVLPDLLLPVLTYSTSIMGNVQQLMNGNFLVNTGDPHSMVMEITNAGEVVWEEERGGVLQVHCIIPHIFGLKPTVGEHAEDQYMQLDMKFGSRYEV